MSTISQPNDDERFTLLRPLSVPEQQRLAIAIACFFSPLNYEQVNQELGLPPTPGQCIPFSVSQFFAWARKTPDMQQVPRLRPHVTQIIARMCDAGLLSHEGKTRGGVLADGNTYYFAPVFTANRKKGSLWLGEALGAPYIAHEISKALVRITGDVDGVEAAGTGLHVLPQYVVTCDHVLRDMEVHKTVVVNGQPVAVEKVLLQQGDNPAIDVGVLRLAVPQDVQLPDLAFRDASLLEKVVVAGYPTIPRGTEGDAVFQTGEICQVSVKTYPQATSVDLFSSIARPGNSGGPLVTMTGNVVGLVTKSLERPTEKIDVLKPLPFFVSVPASDVRSVFQELSGVALPWEDYA
jgi:S1-C subfamily serine protease